MDELCAGGINILFSFFGSSLMSVDLQQHKFGLAFGFFNFFIPNYHRCERKPYKPKIRIDNSGASEWVNRAEYFLSDEGREHLKKMNKFFNEYKAK